MIGATALQQYTVPYRFMLVTRCSSAGSSVLALVSTGRPRPPPALATSTSTRPHSATTRCTIAATAFSSQTSTSMPIALPPPASISATVLSAVIDCASASNSSNDFRFRSVDRDLRTQPGDAPRIGAAEPACRAGDDRHLAVKLAHPASSHIRQPSRRQVLQRAADRLEQRDLLPHRAARAFRRGTARTGCRRCPRGAARRARSDRSDRPPRPAPRRCR